MPEVGIVQRLACKGVIVRDNKVLLLRESSTYKDSTNGGRYQLPCGRINLGEPFLEGLQREMREETGLDVLIGDVIHVGEWFPEIRGVKNHIVGLFFVCDAVASEIILSNEHDDFVWASAEDSAKLDIIMPDILVVQKALA